MSGTENVIEEAPEHDDSKIDIEHEGESPDELLDELDPEFAMFLTYVEALARRAVKEIRDAVVTDAPAVDHDQADEPEPGTDEYDVQNGIPAYAFD